MPTLKVASLGQVPLNKKIKRSIFNHEENEFYLDRLALIRSEKIFMGWKRRTGYYDQTSSHPPSVFAAIQATFRICSSFTCGIPYQDLHSRPS
jgi:hypothetical protein